MGFTSLSQTQSKYTKDYVTFSSEEDYQSLKKLILTRLLKIYYSQRMVRLRACWQWCANGCNNSQQY